MSSLLCRRTRAWGLVHGSSLTALLPVPRPLLAGDGGRGSDDLQQPADREPDPPQGVRSVPADGLPRHHVRAASAPALFNFNNGKNEYRHCCPIGPGYCSHPVSAAAR